MENAIVKILSRIDANNLPVIPKVLVDLMDAIQRQDVNIDSLVKIIEQDAGMSASILAAAHASIYKQWGEITNLKKIVQVMGLSAVKTLIMTRAIQQFFARIPPAQQQHVDIIWYHSLTCAHLARNLAQLTAYEFPDEVYLAGLIHRLGQLILLQCFPLEYSAFLNTHADTQINLEKSQFGAAHHEIGAYVIANWNLQSFIADSVLLQYQAVENILDSAKIVKLLNLASKLSCMDTENRYFIFGQAARLFGLNQSLIETMLAEAQHLVMQSAQQFNIRIDDTKKPMLHNLKTPEEHHAIQEQLGERVKNIALLAAIQNTGHSTVELNKLAMTLQRDMSALFGFPVATLFVYKAETHSLDVVVDNEKLNVWGDLRAIDLNGPINLLQQVWHSRQILHSFKLDKTDPITKLDRRISHLMNTEDMIVFPLVQGDQVMGVIAAGLKRIDVKRIKLNLEFIKLFIGEVAKILHTLQDTSETTPTEAFTEIQTNYALYARKLGHEINNPLSIINNYLYLLSLKLGAEHTDQIRIIQEEITRVSNITLSLSDFSLASVNAINSAVDLNRLITDLITLFEAGIFKTPIITAQLHLDDASSKISIHKDKLKQILTNLIKNAVEAMPAGGEIIISTNAARMPNNRPAVEIKIQDNGPGLPEAVMANLFMPIASTKGSHGAGLGLTICKNLVDELKGSIRCTSVLGGGTTFYILLPKEI